jgi:integrase
VKGFVYQRGSKWYYKFRGAETDPSTGNYPWITKGGFDTKKEASSACREATGEADRGRVVRPSRRTVAQFFAEWFAAVEPSIDATTWQNWKDYAAAYLIPWIGEEHLQRLNEPQLLKLYRRLLTDGRVKPDTNGEMYAYWSDQVTKGENPTPREESEACKTTIHAARAALRRYKSGILPTSTTRGLAPKTVRNVHALIHRALVDAVGWKYINNSPASNVNPPKRTRTRREVWTRDQIEIFLKSVQHDRFAALFLLELTTGIRRGQLCGLNGRPSTSMSARSACTRWPRAGQGRW